MTYYFSTSDGDDSRTSVEAQSPATPWQTITKLNSFFSSLVAGDSVLFKCGDTFYGSITATKSGTAGAPITFGSYDSGDMPVITGFEDVLAFTSLGGNLWQSTSAVSTLATLNMVLSLGFNFQPIGKWPASGYSTIGSHTGGDNAAGTAASITGATPLPDDFTGGEVVIRKRHWIIDRATITSQAGDTLNYVNPSIYGSFDGWGFFVQNHQDACSVDGNWWYDSASKKVGIYNTGGAPTDTKVVNVDILVNIGAQAYLTFTGLRFDGSNSAHFSISSGHHLIFAGCEFNYAGINVFAVQTAAHDISVLTSTTDRVNNNFINAGGSQNWTIIGNQITRIGMAAGMGQSKDGAYIGIYNIGSGSVVQYNDIEETGYNGIDFRGGNIQILNNLINGFCNVKDDGGGIYTYTGPGTTVYALRTVDHNIILNGGDGDSSAGTNTAHRDAFGIYMDGNSSQVDITSNTIAHCGSAGIFFNAAHDIRAVDNTVFNCALTAGAQIVEVYPTVTATAPVRNLTVVGNKFVSKESTQLVASFKTNEANMSQWPLALTNANFNNNFYARPVNEDAETMEIIRAAGTLTTDIPGWAAASGGNLDNSSNSSPITVADPSDIRFEVNPSSDPVTVFLGTDTYIDLAGVGYTGDVELGPWDSLILLLTDAPPPPPTDITQIAIDFTPCPTMPVEGYQILYRVVGDSAYIDAGFFTESPALIPVDYPAGTLFEGVLKSDCGDVPWAGGGEGGGGDCEPVELFEASPPDGFVGIPYSFSVFVGGTGPVDITPTDVPAWMTVAWVEGYIILSGTPTESLDAASINFTYSNCGATWDIGTFISVADLGAIDFRLTETAVTEGEGVRSIQMLSLDGSDQGGYIDWGDGIIESFVLTSFGSVTLFHNYAEIGTEYTSTVYFLNNASLLGYNDIIVGTTYHRVTGFTVSAAFTNAKGALQLIGVDDVATVIPLHGAFGNFSFMEFSGHPDSSMTALDLSILLSNVDLFEVHDFPLLAAVTNVPTTINTLLNFDSNPNLASITAAGGTFGACQNITFSSNKDGIILSTINYSTCTQFSYRQNFSVSQVNAALVGLDGNGLPSGNAFVDQTPDAAPSGAGATAKANLIGKSWSVTTD